MKLDLIQACKEFCAKFFIKINGFKINRCLFIYVAVSVGAIKYWNLFILNEVDDIDFCSSCSV